MSDSQAPLDNAPGVVSSGTAKTEIETVEHYATTQEMERTISKGDLPVMRTKADDLTIWQSVRRYKRVSVLAMTAAFSASLDGYRKLLVTWSPSLEDMLTRY